MNDEERARKLAEMTSNAQWRESEREKNVKRYKEEDEKEESKLDHEREKRDPDFVKRQLASAAASGSVAGRIQSNKHKIQRGAFDMDKNFARR